MNASGDFRPGEVFSLRLCAFLGLIVVALAFLAVSLWNIQVARGARYDDDLARQSIRRVRLPGIRGMITDRNQQVLADNRASYDVALYLEDGREDGNHPDFSETLEGGSGVQPASAQRRSVVRIDTVALHRGERPWSQTRGPAARKSQAPIPRFKQGLSGVEVPGAPDTARPEKSSADRAVENRRARRLPH